MPWKESSVIDERLRFVARLLDGEPMTQVCRDFGISRKTGYKIFGRYKERGLEALCDRSRSAAGEARQSVAIPARGAHRRHQARETALGRQEDPRAPSTPLARGHPSAREEHCPRRSPSPRPRRPPGRPRHRATGTPLSNGSAPNELWCTDFKGEFKLGNGRYCYPLTVTDHASRYLLLCEALESTRPGPRQSACLAVPSCFTTSGAEGHRPYVGLSNLARTPGARLGPARSMTPWSDTVVDTMFTQGFGQKRSGCHARCRGLQLRLPNRWSARKS